MSKLHAAAILVIPAAFALAGSLEPTVSESPAIVREDPRESFLVKLDLARGRRWELGRGGLFVYDIASGELQRAVVLPGAIFTSSRDFASPDMILGRTGALYVSSNATPRIWRVSPARFEVEVYDVQVAEDAGKDFGFSGLAWDAHERTLVATATPLGSVWKIDLGTGRAKKLAPSIAARGPGLLPLAH